MTASGEAVLSVVLKLVPALLIAGILVSFVRLVRGPSLSDRVVALDLIATLAVGIISAQTVERNDDVFLSLAAAVALTTFLGTVAFARYVEKGRLE